MPKKSIAKERQPWVRCTERKIARSEKDWKVKEAMSTKPSKKEIKNLGKVFLIESVFKVWI